MLFTVPVLAHHDVGVNGEIVLGEEVEFWIPTLVCGSWTDSDYIMRAHLESGYLEAKRFTEEYGCGMKYPGLAVFEELMREDRVDFPGHKDVTVSVVRFTNSGEEYFGLISGFTFVDETAEVVEGPK